MVKHFNVCRSVNDSEGVKVIEDGIAVMEQKYGTIVGVPIFMCHLFYGCPRPTTKISKLPYLSPL